MTVLNSACPLDCPDACSLAVTVEEGRITKIDGSRRNPVTEGYICAKVRQMAEHVYGADRLLHPLIRTGARGAGQFRRAAWDEALDLIARKMVEVRESRGGEAILPFSYGGSNGLLTQDTVDARLWRRLGASRLARTVCAASLLLVPMTPTGPRLIQPTTYSRAATDPSAWTTRPSTLRTTPARSSKGTPGNGIER